MFKQFKSQYDKCLHYERKKKKYWEITTIYTGWFGTKVH